MTENYCGRHRAPGRPHPLSLPSSFVKGAVVATAAGALTFGLAAPANATPSVPAAPAAPQTAPAVPQTAIVVTKTTLTRTVTATKLNVRQKASTSSKIMGSLKNGATVKGTKSGSWFKITSGKHKGRYVHASYLASASKAKAKTKTTAVESGSVLAIAKSLTGIKYRYGGTTPAGFDCSGYVQYVFKKAGKKLPRTTHQQYRASKAVSKPKPGDLVFFGSSNPHHVGIYAGNGMMYDSPRSGKSTTLRKVFTSSKASYRRA